MVVNRVVLFSPGQSCVDVTGVFAEDERGMVEVVNLLVIDGSLDLVSGPSGVAWRSEIVLLTDKHDDWHLRNGGHVDHWSSLLTINLKVGSGTSIVIFLEIARRCFLSIVIKLFP